MRTKFTLRGVVVTLAGAAMTGAVGGLVNLNVQHYAKGTPFESILDLLQPAMLWLKEVTTDPRFLIATAFLVGGSLFLWTDAIIRRWSLWRSNNGGFYFRRIDRRLVAMTAVLIFGSGFVVSVIWLAIETRMQSMRPMIAQVARPLTPITAPLATNPEEQERNRREALLKARGEMERLARDAAGTPITVTFGQVTVENLQIKDGDVQYDLPVSISNSTGAFVFSSGSAKVVRLSKSIEHGKSIDIRQIRVAKGGTHISIGEHAFIELTNGKILQLTVVGVLWYFEGDDLDEIRFKYKLYDVGEFLIDSL